MPDAQPRDAQPRDAQPLDAKPRDAIPTAFPREPDWDDLGYLRRLAELGPLVRDRHGILLAFSMAHLQHCVSSDLTRQPEVDTLTLQGITEGPVYDFAANSLLYSNPPRHRARRTPLARAFAFPLMEALRPAITAAAEAQIAPCLGRETDFLAEIASPLPARIIATILGAPEADVPRFSTLVHSASRALSVRSPEVMAEAARGMRDLADYIDGLLAARRRAPLDDFLSEYVERADESDLTPDEVRAQIVTLVLAGADTTRLALSMTFTRLLETRAAWEALCAEPEALKAGAAAEGLRVDPPVGMLAQVTLAGFEIAGHRPAPGTLVGPALITALRDPEVYAEPDRFDIRRADHPRLHPVFGAGAHRCLGEALARAELEEILAVLARLAPGAELAGPPPALRGLGAVRGISAMRVRL